MEKKNIWLIITSVIFGIGFFVSGILTTVNTNYNIGVALGFLIGVFEMLLLINLSKIYPNKKKDNE